jgi:hypothetical protein
LKNLLGLPKSYLDELMGELEKPRSQQVITVGMNRSGFHAGCLV